MRAFHMNLLTYNANTQFPQGQLATAKQQNLRNQMTVIGAPAFDIAGFTEVGVANAANPVNVRNALDDFGTALGIPQAVNGARRHMAVIRCGRTALVDSNEVVALVINGNAVINYYDLIYFDRVGPANVLTSRTAPDATANRYTSVLNIPNGAVPDYRYIVRVNFTLNGHMYDIGFVHNRAPGNDHVAVVMPWIRTMLEQGTLGLCGGDFNTTPPAGVVNGNGILLPVNVHRQNAYYSPGLTTVANPYDYWIGGNAVLNAPPGGGVASAGRTAHPPAPGVTGSDHCGVWINIA